MTANEPASTVYPGSWAGLSDEHLEICLQDFVFLSRPGMQFRSMHAVTRDQLVAECALRRRLDIAERAMIFGRKR